MWQGRFRAVLLWLTDLVGIYAVWLFTVWAYRAAGFGYYEYGFSFYFNLWPVGFLFTSINAFFKLYHGNVFYPAAPVSPVEELRRLIASSAFTHLALIAFLALSRQTTEDYSRAVVILSGIFTAFIAQPLRNLLRNILHKYNLAQIPVVLIGAPQANERLVNSLNRDSYTGFRVCCLLTDCDVGTLVAESRKHGIKILVSCQEMKFFQSGMDVLTEWFTFLEYIPPRSVFPVHGAQPVVIDEHGGFELVNQRRMRAVRLGKSLLDFLLSLIAFVLLIPCFVIIPLLIVITSKGPVFYRAERLGRGSRRIRVWKFRSMYSDADKRLDELLASNPSLKAEYDANFKLASDPRVTPLGRFLRKTSLDEIPQLFNVFSGEMALIGPRPIVEKEVPYYGDAYKVFSSVKPGITGLWQCSGRSDTDYPRRVALDSYYVLNWSPWLDIWILFRTVGAVLFMRGAR